jgi:hypothetical protein
MVRSATFFGCIRCHGTRLSRGMPLMYRRLAWISCCGLQSHTLLSLSQHQRQELSRCTVYRCCCLATAGQLPSWSHLHTLACMACSMFAALLYDAWHMIPICCGSVPAHNHKSLCCPCGVASWKGTALKLHTLGTNTMRVCETFKVHRCAAMGCGPS